MPNQTNDESGAHALLDQVTALLDTAIADDAPLRDAYEWCAIFDDGTHLLEHDDGPHPFAEIDQDRLVEFQLHPQRGQGSVHAVHLEPLWRLIFFRRVGITANGPDAGIVRKLHVIGRQATIGTGASAVNIKHLMAITEDGHTFTTSDDDLIQA